MISNYAENKILNTIRGSTWTAPVATYLGLYTNIPDDSTPGLFVVDAELKKVTWRLPVEGVMTNANILTFGPANSEWGIIRSWGLYDSMGGAPNLLWSGSFVAPFDIDIGDTLTIPADAISLTVD